MLYRQRLLARHTLALACVFGLQIFYGALSPAHLSAEAARASSFADATGDAERQEGFVPFYWIEAEGRVLIEIPAFNEDVLYYISAATGGGSVELSLDRGIMDSSVIHFRRSGPQVLVVEQNLGYRSIGGSESRARNVQDSFADSVLASLPIEAIEEDRILVDATALFMRDAANLAGELNEARQGEFRFDAERSAFYPPRIKAFPENTEIETIVTFGIDGAGEVVNAIAPDERALTLRIHHSFLKAPEGYTPRPADPRIGVGSVEFRNYAAAFDRSTEAGWVTRWRLEKKNPEAELSEPVEPIVFYLDPAIPEPIRSAMREGTLWWNEAFEAAGFRNAVQVRDPAPDMDPMDIRYAWVLWIERDERGFSSSGSFRDPRTGEILGSKTRMDSHRIRTIANYWESYMQAARADGEMPAEQREMALLRQSVLIAHELGHALGFGHNWASSRNDRASVMEYPTPRVEVKDGRIDLSDAFEEGVGAYDVFMTRYAYTPLPPESEESGLDTIIAEMRENGILYVPSTDPRWAWYDDRSSPAEYLRETMAAREILIDQYGPEMLEPGEPIGSLRDLRFWMTYLHHRWAIEAGLRYVGGMYHNIALKGETLEPTRIVPADLERDVLDLLMQAIEPEALALPESLLRQLTPDPGSNLEDLSSGYAFDHLEAARILAAMVIEPLLAPDRAARLVAFADRQPDTVSLPEVVATLLEHTWYASRDDGRHASLRRVTQQVALDALMILAASRESTPVARAYALDQLSLLADDLRSWRADDPLTEAHYRQSARDIERYLENPAEHAPESASESWGDRPRSRYPLPPGPPL